MNIYITLDYELFLGERTGTPENCLIRPMDELCKVADEHHFKFIIFVDATYLLRMHQLKGLFKEVDRHYDLVSNHVKLLAEQGHDVELHFHPQWLYSDWDEATQQWIMDRYHYKLSDMPLVDAKKYLKEAKNLLDSIVGYKTIAYRAGGFCLDEFKEFKEVFSDLNIKYDSSVARGIHISSSIHNFDYRRIPSNQIYRFDNSITTESKGGAFTELSISSFSCSPLEFIQKIRPLKNKYSPKMVYQDGIAINDGISLFKHRLKKLLTKNTFLASIDGPSSNLLNLYYEKAKANRQSDLVLIGHPKNASDVSLSNLKYFIEGLKGKAVFKTLSDINIES